MVKLRGLCFVIGGFSDVCKFIIARFLQRKSTIYLPCSLYDFACICNNRGSASGYSSIDFCTTDSMPLVWFVRALGYQRAERVYGPHLTNTLLFAFPAGVQHVFLAPTKVVGGQLAMVLLKRFPTVNKPNIIIVPKNHAAFEPRKRLSFVPTNSQRVVFWIGIGSPSQAFMAKRLRRPFPKATIFCVGASLEFLAGVKPFAPRWMQHMGLEWLFRLLVEPERLYKRYLWLIPRFLFREALTQLKGYFSL